MKSAVLDFRSATLKMITVFTALCFDETERDVGYPQMKAGWHRRIEYYWQCAFVMAWSARKTGHSGPIVIVTNKVELCPKEIADKLGEMRVDIVEKPFVDFASRPGFSRAFRSAYYKLEAYRWFGSSGETDRGVFVDADCVFVSNLANFAGLVDGEDIWLYDVYGMHKGVGSEAAKKRSELLCIWSEAGLSSKNEGVVQFGGEFAAGPRGFFGDVADSAFQVFTEVGKREIVRKCGASIFDGDEFLVSYVLKNMSNRWCDAGGKIVQRIWTNRYASGFKNASSTAIWHLPGEKRYGFDYLARKLLTDCWRLEWSREVAAGIFGIPRRSGVGIGRLFLYGKAVELFRLFSRQVG